MEEINLPENWKGRPDILVWRTKLHRKEKRDGRRRETRKQQNNEGTRNDRERTNGYS